MVTWHQVNEISASSTSVATYIMSSVVMECRVSTYNEGDGEM